MPNGRRGQGQGRGGGRGLGRGGGWGGAQGGRGQGRGQGRGGVCICPSCNTEVPHQPGIPCREMRCPHCGAQMVRE